MSVVVWIAACVEVIIFSATLTPQSVCLLFLREVLPLLFHLERSICAFIACSFVQQFGQLQLLHRQYRDLYFILLYFICYLFYLWENTHSQALKVAIIPCTKLFIFIVDNSTFVFSVLYNCRQTLNTRLLAKWLQFQLCCNLVYAFRKELMNKCCWKRKSFRRIVSCHFFEKITKFKRSMVIMIDLPKIALIFVSESFVVRINQLRSSKWTQLSYENK